MRSHTDDFPEAVPPATPIIKGVLKEQRLLVGEMLPVKIPFDELPDLSLMALLIEMLHRASDFKLCVQEKFIFDKEAKFISKETWGSLFDDFFNIYTYF